MKVPPVPRGTVRNFIAVTGLLIGTGCGGGHATRVAANPAVRLDRPSPATPAEVRASVAFKEETIRQEGLGAGSPQDHGRAEEARPQRRPDADSSSRGRKPAETPAARGANATEEDEDDAPVRHVLRRGQTLYSVARMYGVEVSALMKANGIDNARHVASGTVLVIPLPKPPRRAAAVNTASIAPLPGGSSSADGAGASGEPSSGNGRKKKQDGDKQTGDRKDGAGPPREAAAPALAWPIQGLITAPFGRRGREDRHEGIDIDGQTGDPIRAAASGTVVFAGTHGDYGRTVVIDHGEGLRTIYAHASSLKVQEGDPVRVGETIAEVGHSGNARGSHLHFEVRRDGRAVNPMPYLRSPDLLTAGVVPAPKARGKSTKGKAATRD
jgi:murein DD-endopeptidase MepM/ murein hydrolase activator NlpD